MQNIKNKVKNTNLVGVIYRYIIMIFLNILKLFVQVNEHQILFMSYSGRQFSDSPREAYLSFLDDERFKDYTLIWALNEPEKIPELDNKHKIKANSLVYFIKLIESKYWISNASIDRLVPIKHPKNIYIQFWHGIPMKHLGPKYEKNLSNLVSNWYRNVEFDYLFSYGPYDKKIMADIFPKSKKILEVGQLRKRSVDRREKQTSVQQARKKLGIKNDKPILLYVPTFREYHPTMSTGFSEDFLRELSKDYHIIYRGHYFSIGGMVNGIQVENEISLYLLFIAADVLVTDYSSVMFDFAVMNKPIYLYQPDLKEYTYRRGLYLGGKQLKLPIAYSEQMLRSNMREDYNIKRVNAMNRKFNPHNKDEAWESLANIILEN